MLTPGLIAIDKSSDVFLIIFKTHIGMLTPGATELFGGGRIPP